MSNHVKENVWLIGAGKMAVQYAKVLTAMNIKPVVIGRGEASASEFTKATGLDVVTGGLPEFLKTKPGMPSAAINAVNVLELSSITRLVLDYSQPRMLIEKPAGINEKQLQDIDESIESAEVFVAYNRRFYASVQKAKEIIENDGGPLACSFEFTEWGHVIEKQVDQRPSEELAHWALANSSHIFDLAFFLAGEPEQLSTYTAGGLSWHPNASRFCGAGISARGATISYHANWDAPGRWRVEVMSANYRLLLCPLEEVQLQKKGAVTWDAIELDTELDEVYKPGLYSMLTAFLSDEPSRDLCSFGEVKEVFSTYQKIAGYI